MAEHELPKLGVEGSIPFTRSKLFGEPSIPPQRIENQPAGLVAPGPLGAIAGAFPGGNKKQVSFAAELDDGRKFMAVIDSKARRKIAAAVFERDGSDDNLKGPKIVVCS